MPTRWTRTGSLLHPWTLVKLPRSVIMSTYALCKQIEGLPNAIRDVRSRLEEAMERAPTPRSSVEKDLANLRKCIRRAEQTVRNAVGALLEKPPVRDYLGLPEAVDPDTDEEVVELQRRSHDLVTRLAARLGLEVEEGDRPEGVAAKAKANNIVM